MRFRVKKVNDTKVRDLKFTRCYTSPWLYSGFRLSLFFLASVILFLFLFPPLPARCYVPDDLDFVPMEEETPPGPGQKGQSQGQAQEQGQGQSQGQGQGQGAGKTVTAPSNRFITAPSINYKMVYIQPGTFMMGSPLNEKERDNDEVQHKVTLTQGFYLGVTEVTVGQFRKFVQETSYKTEAEQGEGAYIWTGSEWGMKKDANWMNPYFEQEEANPVVCVSWNDTKAFCEWLSRKEGKTYRLPTESEWEYACRAGTGTPFCFGLCLSTEQANYNGNYPYSGCAKGQYREKTLSVGSFPPNAWDLYDMHGNVWEWCQDLYGEYPAGSGNDPKGSSKGSNRVNRGGSWRYFAGNCRSADRSRLIPSVSYVNLGFRLSRTP